MGIVFITDSPVSAARQQLPPTLTPREAVQVLHALETAVDPSAVCDPIWRRHGREFSSVKRPRQMLGAASGRSGGLRGRVQRLIDDGNEEAINEARALGYK